MPRLPEHYFLEITQSLDKMAFSDKLLGVIAVTDGDSNTGWIGKFTQYFFFYHLWNVSQILDVTYNHFVRSQHKQRPY